jgi:glycosyltransferase involved in cell wall biosynthesis
MRKIALIPVYNEETTLRRVVDGLVRHVELLVIVDDGSTDDSFAIARERALSQNSVRVLRLPENQGMSAALREGFLYLISRMRAGKLDADDLVFTLDADGQHDPEEIQALGEYVGGRGLDVALTRRDFSLYPAYKRWGNRFMSVWGSLWSGFHYHDVESGFRAMRLRVLPALMEYYKGRRYSCAQEIAILTARLGFRVDNGFVTRIRLYRSQTGPRDVATNALMGALACLRWSFGLRTGGRIGAERIPAARTQRRGPSR